MVSEYSGVALVRLTPLLDPPREAAGRRTVAACPPPCLVLSDGLQRSDAEVVYHAAGVSALPPVIGVLHPFTAGNRGVTSLYRR